jgi:hypothetical protein
LERRTKKQLFSPSGLAGSACEIHFSVRRTNSLALKMSRRGGGRAIAFPMTSRRVPITGGRVTGGRVTGRRLTGGRVTGTSRLMISFKLKSHSDHGNMAMGNIESLSISAGCKVGWPNGHQSDNQ